MSVKPRVNLILDSLILVAFVLTVLSGLALGHTLDSVRHQPGQAVDSIVELSAIHAMTRLHVGMSLAFLLLIAIHLVVHWKWVVSQVKLLLRGSRQQAPVLEN